MMTDSSKNLEKHLFRDNFKKLLSMIERYDLSPKITKKNKVENIQSIIDKFITIYSDSFDKKAFNNDLSSAFFDKIQNLIESFIRNIEYNSTKKDCPEIIRRFQDDLNIFISNFVVLIKRCTINFEKIHKIVNQGLEEQYLGRVLNQYYLELAMFEYVHNIKTMDQPPFYQISNLPIYQYLHEQFYEAINKFINIASQHGSGKTSLIPLFLASRSLGVNIRSRFIIVIENDVSSIQNLKKLYKQINTNKNSYMKKVDNYLLITSSLSKFYDKCKKGGESTIIAILTPLEGVQLICKMVSDTSEDVSFLKNSTFVLDDINQRKIETDVLAQNILNRVFNQDLFRERAKIVLLGNYFDSRFSAIFRNHCDSLEVPVKTKNITIKEVNCKNYLEICKMSIIHEMKNFFDSWKKNDEVNIGSVIVFVPNVKAGRILIKNLFKIYSNNSINVVPLQTKFKKGESLINFNERLIKDIGNELDERLKDSIFENPEMDKNDDMIFIYPIDFTGNVNEEERQFIQSSLPSPLIEKRLVRVIISTNQNEHFIKVPDATVIFDSALTEVEYYDVNKSVTIFKTEQLPDHDINQRNALIEDNNRNVHFVFKVQNHRKIDKVVPFIRRCDLIKSILQLRSIDVDFEKQRNLPDEPVYDNVVNQMNNLKKLNLIKPKSGELTELGKQISKFSFVSPYLAIATANFKKNQEFAFLVSLIIDKSIELIENSQAPLLCDHFCNESDVVTILDTILALNTNERNEIINENKVKYENSGISMSALELFYLAITNTFHKKNKAEGRESMINSIKWSKGQPGGTIAMIDEYINLLDKDKFLNIRKAAFKYIVGVGTISEPTIVYKANDVLKFDDDLSEDALVKFSKRPGCNGLQSPGNIIVLSFQIEEAIKLNRGFLLHRDLSAEEENLGVVSQEAKSFLNSCFFVALFEAYWNGNPMVNNLIPIYHSNNPKKDAGFLIHINECNKKTYISYCPKTQDVRDEMNRSISFLSSLMPYVPRSIVSKSDTPLCAVEIISYGTSEKYQSHVFLIDQPTKPKPIAYPLNKQLLEYAGSKIDELRKTNPKIRFSITGESIYYKFNGKRQVEADFSYPDVDPNIKSVFDPLHSSHLVLLIDQDYGNKPSVSPIPWISNSKADEDKMKQNENDETDMMIDISTKIINDLGSIRRSEDLFFITLNNGYPSVKKGEIPDIIKEQIGYDESDQKAIKLGIHQLIQQITKKLIRNNISTSPLLLKELSSTNHCNLYTTEESQDSACQQIVGIISRNLGINILNIKAAFVGPSMICLSIDNLDPKRTSHPPPINIWDDSYHKCEIDDQISNILISNSFPVTSVTHEPTVEIIIYHLPRFGIQKEEFEQKVNEIADKFGFLNYFRPNYKVGGHDVETESRVLGEMVIGLLGQNCCIECATCISKQFPVFQGDEDLGIKLSITMTMSAMDTLQSLHEINPHLGIVPKIGPVDKVIHVPECEIEAMKDLVKTNKQWRFNEDYRVLIIKLDEEEEAKRKMQKVRQEKMNTTCFLSCGMDEPELLPQFLFVNEEDGTVKQIGICKKCAKDMFASYEDIEFVYNPHKHMIYLDRLKQLPMTIKGIQLIPQIENGKNEWWPQIPLGQLIWALISDPYDDLTSFVKAWFTIATEYAIQHSDYFMFCPDHPQIPIIRPGDNETVKCPACNMIYCKDCNSWHKMDAECSEGFISDEVKRCPKCHIPGIRYEGCDHMTCPSCGCQWNYQTCQKM